MSYFNDQQLCRICLQINGCDVNIFTTMIGSKLVANLLAKYGEVEVTSDDKLPPNICSICLDTLETVNEFRHLIRSSNDVLQEMIPPVETFTEGAEEILVIDEKDVEEITFMNITFENKKEYVVEEEIEDPNESEIIETQEEVTVTTEEFITFPTTEPHSNCCACSEHFPNNDALLCHFQVEHSSRIRVNDSSDPGLNTCQLCQKQFRKKSALQSHQVYFQKLIACSICGINVNRNVLKAHIARQHGGTPVECEICHKMLKSAIVLREHKLKLHSNQQFECDICGKAFPNKVYCQRHKVTHDPNRKKLIQCEACHKTFENQTLLRKHMRIHTGEKSYKCGICQAAFIHNTDHRRHMWTHTGSPHQCKKCEKSFDRPRNLRNHEMNCGVSLPRLKECPAK